ncbi:MAG: hypothetical protein HGA46_04310, partial [Chlorobiaceae bacterium]|nr:hypothetical protein [Chlorobiaceae bacterium]
MAAGKLQEQDIFCFMASRSEHADLSDLSGDSGFKKIATISLAALGVVFGDIG